MNDDLVDPIIDPADKDDAILAGGLIDEEEVEEVEGDGITIPMSELEAEEEEEEEDDDLLDGYDS